MTDKLFYEVDGKEYCNEEAILSILLADDVLFANERKYDEVWTVVLYVNCSDTFYWATADAEDLPLDEVGPLYKMHLANKKWGATKWCCLRRKLRPQVPVVKMMKEENAWDAELEALPAPEPS